MPNILPVSDLRNYNEVLKNCQVGEPVFLTKNGRGRFVVMDIEDTGNIFGIVTILSKSILYSIFYYSQRRCKNQRRFLQRFPYLQCLLLFRPL